MVSGIADILILSVDVAAVLRIRQQRLRYRGSATGHLLDPAAVRNRYPIQHRLTRLELVVEFGAHRQVGGINSVERVDLGKQPSSLVAHVSQAAVEVFAELVLDREPAEKEASRLHSYFEQERAKFGERSAWTSVASVLLNLDEFIVRE